MIDEGLWLVCYERQDEVHSCFIRISENMDEINLYQSLFDMQGSEPLVITNMVRLGDLKGDENAKNT